MQSTHFSVVQVLEDSINLFKQLAKDKKIWLYYIYDSSLPEKIRTDQKRFQKILIKILSVSIKYTERGQIKVSA
jgi:signal transduction histidine kinase